MLARVLWVVQRLDKPSCSELHIRRGHCPATDTRGQIKHWACTAQPILMPILIQITMLMLRLEPFQSAQSAAWIIIMWGVLPTFLAMRGIAMLRIAELIIEKRHSNNAHSMLQMA